MEKVLKSCNSITEIRATARRKEGLKEAFVDHMQPVLSLLCGQFGRMMLKEEPTTPCITTASDEELTKNYM